MINCDELSRYVLPAFGTASPVPRSLYSLTPIVAFDEFFLLLALALVLTSLCLLPRIAAPMLNLYQFGPHNTTATLYFPISSSY